MVDLDDGKVVDRALLGEHPSFVANTGAGESFGPPPRGDLVAYLKGLPHR